MAREKTVYSPDMVCHLWANRHPVNVRNSTGNIYTQGGALFSYGDHYAIGAFLDNPKDGPALLLWNDDGYSSTTARQTSKAWGALTRDQRERAIRVPGMSSADLKNPEALAVALVRRAVQLLEKSDKARTNRPRLIGDARRSLDGARAIYTYTGNKKAGKAVPVLSSDDVAREEAAAVVAACNAAEIKQKAAKDEAYALEYLTTAERYAEAVRHAADWVTAADVMSHARSAQHAAKRAAAALASVKARKPATLGKIEKAAAALLAEFAPIAHDDDVRRARVRTSGNAAGVVSYLARYRRQRHGKTGGAYRITTGRGFPVTADSLARLHDDVARTMPAARAAAAELYPCEKERAQVFATLDHGLRRMRAIYKMEELRAAARREGDALADRLKDRNFSSFCQPNAQTLRGLIDDLTQLNCHDAGRMLAPYLALLAEVDAYRADYDAHHAAERARKALEAAQRNAEAVAAWRRGEAVRLPHDVPTLARVRGERVETSRGAVVPLDHAARLVRIAQKVAAAGGIEYAQGSGPMVGAFRVTSVAADLRTVIGCHTFEAEEAQRAAAEVLAAWAKRGEAVAA